MHQNMHASLKRWRWNEEPKRNVKGFVVFALQVLSHFLQAYWAKAKAQAAENWKRIMANQQQRVPDVSDRVVVAFREIIGLDFPF